ncbi:MATE family efflux transporter [Campylobacter corcagiensis]|uniref:MATE family efflux transporter n=1 Tax=Campylobacter corcagiensis TaxID=1448857 RepID=A0A7M1LEI6_9BACT|nr:MATE family efflux transporter [Campylobacter corcagiensis]QKF65113.1 MATE family efflux protein [Campylobacter corcagiensis]QOQ86743.1 MATE family efflux transporter [Campylobacter corcagiensis]
MEKEISLKNLFFPIYINMLLSLSTVMANTFMMSMIDPRLVGAMGAGNQVMVLFQTVFNLLAVGCSIVVAQAIGAKNRRLSIKAVHVSISFNFVVGFISGIFVFFGAFFMLHMLQVPDGVFDESYHYLRVISIALIFDALAIVLIAVIRAYGYATYTMIAAICISVLTILGNYIALFEPFGIPYYGLEGVGYSTIFGRFIGVIILFVLLIKVVKFKIYMRFFFKIPLYVLSKIIKIGLPAAGEEAVWTIQYLTAFAFVASMGESSLATQTIYFQISAFIFFASAAIGLANEIIVARLIGSGENEKAYHTTFRNLFIGLVTTALFLVVIFSLKHNIMRALNLTPDIVKLMLPLFTLSIFLELSRTLNVIMVNAIRATGDAKFPFYMGVIFMLGVSLPVGWYLGIHLEWGILGVWIGFVADEFLRGLAHLLRWKSKKWQGKQLV